MFPPPVPFLSQLDPVHNSTSYFPKIHLNIILQSTRGSPKWPLSLRFPTKTLNTRLLFSIRPTCPAHLILLDFVTRKILGEQYRSLSSPAALVQIKSTNFNLNRKTRNCVLQQGVGTATELCLYTSSVFNYVQIPLCIWYNVH